MAPVPRNWSHREALEVFEHALSRLKFFEDMRDSLLKEYVGLPPDDNVGLQRVGALLSICRKKSGNETDVEEPQIAPLREHYKTKILRPTFAVADCMFLTLLNTTTKRNKIKIYPNIWVSLHSLYCQLFRRIR